MNSYCRRRPRDMSSHERVDEPHMQSRSVVRPLRQQTIIGDDAERPLHRLGEPLCATTLPVLARFCEEQCPVDPARK